MEALELNRNTLLIYLGILEKTGIINTLFNSGSFYGKLTKPEKILLNHPNIANAITTGEVDPGSIREGFFVNQLMAGHKVELAEKGDFLVVVDDTETGYENKIPLWLFGFLY